MDEFKSDSSVRRVMKNGAFTAFRFGMFTLSGIFFIPFLIKQYGTGSYGLIALAGFLTQYVGFISGSIGNSIGRFLNIALNKGDWKQANEIFSTAIVANLALILFQLPFFALGLWKLDFLIDFSEELGSDFRILVACNILVYLSSVFLGVLSTPILAANRLDIGVKLEILSQVIRLVLLVSMILSIGPRLWIIGVVDLSLAIIGIGVIYTVY